MPQENQQSLLQSAWRIFAKKIASLRTRQLTIVDAFEEKAKEEQFKQIRQNIKKL